MKRHVEGCHEAGEGCCYVLFFYHCVKGVGCVMVDKEGDKDEEEKGEGDFDNEWERW